jgi:DNA-binding transcriptional ArsR family regulator
MVIAYVVLTLLDIVSSRRKAEVLRLLFGVEPREVHLRDLTRRSGLALRTVQQELARLGSAGLVTSRRDGNRVYYGANRNSPVYADLRSIVLKTAGLADVLRSALQGADVELAFVFGSIAAESARSESDIDLMVIGPLGLRRLAKALHGVALRIGREINPHVLTREEFVRRKRLGDHFISSLLASPRLFIVGTDDELAKLGR